MGTKKAISTIFDTLSNLSIHDHKFHPGGRNSRDPSPVPKNAASLEQERVNKQNKNRKEEADQRQHFESDIAPDCWVREGERERIVKERRQEDGRSRNGRLLSSVEPKTGRDVKKGGKRGDTFPRMKNLDTGPESKLMPHVEMEEDRKQGDHLQREEMDTWEKKRHMYSEKKDGQSPRQRQDEARMYSLHRLEREIQAERKERAQRKEGRKDARNEGDIDESELRRMKDREREELMNQFSRYDGINRIKMHMKRDKDGQRYGDRGREIKTDRSRRREEDKWIGYDKVITRAERHVDRDEILRPERKVTDDKREDDQYRNERRYRETNDCQTDKSSRSMNSSAQRLPPQVQGSREQGSKGDIEKYRQDRDGHRKRERRIKSTFEGERTKDRHSEPEGAAYRSQKQQKRSEEQGGGRKETTSSLPMKKRMWLEPQGGKNIEDENRTSYQRQKEERRKEKNEESRAEKGRPKWRGKTEPGETNLEQSCSKGRHEGREEYSGDSEGASVDDELTEIWSKREVKEHLPHSGGRIEERRQGDVQREIMTDNNGGSDTDEDGGRKHWAHSGNKRVSDASWKQDRKLSGENTFVTLSSGGDDEEEQEDYQGANDCKQFRDADVSDEDPTPDSSKSSEGEERDKFTRNEEVVNGAQGRQKNLKYAFCVTEQSPSQSETTELSLSEDDEVGRIEIEEPNLEKHTQSSDEATQEPQDDQHLTYSRKDKQSVSSNQDKESDYNLPKEEGLFSGDTTEGDIRCNASKEHQDLELGEEMRSKEERQHIGFGGVKRDSKTEILLEHWRENNKEGLQSNADVRTSDSFDRIPHFLDDMNIESMSQEEMEKVRASMSGAWSMSKVPKRHSQAPHLKWATSVVREILGHSDEQTIDKPNTELQQSQEVKPVEYKKQEMIPGRSIDLPIFTVTKHDRHSDPELEEEDLEVEFKGEKEEQTMDQKTELSVQAQLEKAEINDLRKTDKETSKENEVEAFLTMTNALYKPGSCPNLNYDSESDLVPTEGRGQEVEDEMSDDRWTEEDHSEKEETEVEGRMDNIGAVKNGATITKSSSFLNVGSEVRIRRRGIRITNKRKDEGGVARDRRARVFSPADDDHSKSWGELNLRNAFHKMARVEGNSSFLNAAQLYQQYSEVAQNIEILRQFHSDVLSVCEDPNHSPTPSPPPARRPLPPLPAITQSFSLSHTGSVTSVKSLPLPDLPRTERRSSSPRLSTSLAQHSLLWRDLPEVRNDPELEMLTEDQWRLQEVRFEVVTSEASYCRSLDIVVDHFVKSRQLETLLTTQDKNWLFSRLYDVRVISRRFLSRLEERLESDIMHFTVCDIIVKQCQLFRKVYVPYLTNQSYQDATYQKLMNGNPGFKRVVELLEKSPVCQRLPLRSFLVLPFQRITRLRLLVQNIVKRTTPGTVEATNAIKALKLLDKIIQESNDSISQMKNIESLVTLNSKVDFECRTLPLVSQSRRLVREGSVIQLMDLPQKETERNIYLHLFNDYLLISVQKEGGKFTVIDHCPVKELRAENFRVKILSLQRNVFRLHWTNEPLLLRTESQSDKLRWISAISRPHSELDFSAAEDLAQMQCVRAYVAQQPDELSLEKADVIVVHQDTSDNWVEGTKLSDLNQGWVPKSHLEVIINPKARKQNLSDAYKLTTVTAEV
ncbi:trichohyalin isoform X1 [Austrofundulus limnaeus]|uniref:Trichohyalin isoform X1 n=1 Tax=Austrofundulus limnaeus TaxID=52670 RepID=A0A2I4BK07_AUSLI|nr:PREDICTED: trichohyalin-like isoform X1 [Austrofundulus limnaeus]